MAFGGQSISAAPPPPRFVTIPNTIRVVALWGNSNNDRGPLPQSGVQQAAADDTTLLSKTASAASVASGGTLHYSLVVTNATNVTQSFRITDTLPNGLSYITNTATGGLVYNAAFTRLTATTPIMNAFEGNVVSTSGAPPYTEIISDTQAANICQSYFPACDNNAVTLALPLSFRYLGVDYTTMTLDSNGFVMPGSPLLHELDTDNQNQHLPDIAAPNDIIAPFWDDLDLHGQSGDPSGAGDWLYALKLDQGAEYLVVEWHNAQKHGSLGTAYSFQVWVQLQAEHITFAYRNPAFTGTTSSATVGFENSDGTLGHSYLYAGAGAVPANGSELALEALYDTAEYGFNVRAQPSVRGCLPITNTNTAKLSNKSGTLHATAAATIYIFGPCAFLPLIVR